MRFSKTRSAVRALLPGAIVAALLLTAAAPVAQAAGGSVTGTGRHQGADPPFPFIQVHVNAFSDAGVMMVYAGTSPEKGDELLAVVGQELRELRDSGPGEREVEVAKEHLKELRGIRSAPEVGFDPHLGAAGHVHHVKGASFPNWVGHDQLTPLDAARRSNADDVVAWLLGRGARSKDELR